MCVYIYRERERERDIERGLFMYSTYIYSCICIQYMCHDHILITRLTDACSLSAHLLHLLGARGEGDLDGLATLREMGGAPRNPAPRNYLLV